MEKYKLIKVKKEAHDAIGEIKNIFSEKITGNITISKILIWIKNNGIKL